MTTKTKSEFQPDWVSPPGDTIADLLEERSWTQTEFATRIGASEKHVSQLIGGKASLTEETAKKLSTVLGSSIAFWLTREAQYRAALAERDEDTGPSDILWAKELPIRDLMAAGSIPSRRCSGANWPLITQDALRFFGIASPEEWKTKYGALEASFFRSRTDQSDIAAITAWLRQGEVIAEGWNGPAFDRKVFSSGIESLRALTIKPPDVFEPELREFCRRCGVIFALVPAIPRTFVSGVARWLSPTRPLIQLSLYGKTNDRFWFAFFHEAAHLLLHDKTRVFLDDPGRLGTDLKEEREANSWAAKLLIPEEVASRLSSLTTAQAIRSFAREIGVHPGIVVGRLQHDGFIEQSWHNNLKEYFKLRSATAR